jgi:hypothetical protein
MRVQTRGRRSIIHSRSDFAGQPVLQIGTLTVSDHEGNTSVTQRLVFQGVGETF